MTGPAVHVACLTPAGQGALATIGVCGLGVWEQLRAVFRPRTGALPDKPEAGTFRLGLLGDLGEEAVLAVKRVGSPEVVELHCHGGRAAVGYVLEVFAGRGARIVESEEWLRAAGLERWRAEAVAALASATTTRTAGILLGQYHGALARSMAAGRAALERHDTASARLVLVEALRWRALGQHLVTPWRVVLAGPPNVGKSSLLNTLAGYQRSVVAATPGTTRDVVTVRLAVEGWPMEVADTAGRRRSGDALEAAGVAMAQQQVEQADLCLWLLDATAAPIYPDDMPGNLRFVVNKMDQPAAWDLNGVDAVPVSARTGEGVPELCRRMAEWLVPAVPPPGAAVPFTALQATCLAKALEATEAGDVAGALAALQSIEED